MNAATAIRDPRHNKPSASIFGRLRACPGSWLLSQGQPDVETPYGKRGTDIHRWIQSKLTNPPTPSPTLSPEDEETAATCLKLVDRACAAAGYGSRSTATNVFVEQRLWHDDSWSGQFDLALHWNDRWLLIDFKTGRAENDEPADNQQLRALVALLASNYFPSEVTVAIIQPWVSPQIPPLSKYAGPALAQAETESDGIVAAALAPGAPRTPGDHCTYCPAGCAGVCPELNGTLTVVVTAPPTETLTEFHVSKLLDACELAEMAIDAIRKRAKQMLGDNIDVPGWELTAGAVREKITDVMNVWQRASAFGVPQEKFVARCAMTKKDLKEMLRDATGKKGAALDDIMETMLKDCTESKPTAPSLKRV